jgi:hypothetical protein
MTNKIVTYSDEQIALQSLLDSGLIPAWRVDFVQSISYATKPSPKQMDWITKILNEVLTDASLTQTSPAPSDAKAYDAIFAMFETAKKHLKWPKVTLAMKSGLTVKLSVASSAAKHPGAISIITDGAYCGRITPAAPHALILTREGRNHETQLREFLAEFDKDPAGMATAYGKLTSKCAFCGLPLSTPESLAVGYGDTCAKHYGLPWGKVKFDPNVIVDLRGVAA